MECNLRSTRGCGLAKEWVPFKLGGGAAESSQHGGTVAIRIP